MAYVIKRDGRYEPFDKKKIESAILQAFYAVVIKTSDTTDAKLIEDIKLKATKIAESAEEIVSKSKNGISVEYIQDYVEKSLMASKYKDVAKSYILYRDARSRERTKKEKLFKEVNEKLAATAVENQNANVDEHSFGGRKGEAANAIMKQYALDYYMSDMAKNNHLNNEVYIHDLDNYVIGTHNCLSIPFDDLLANGFNTRQADVRPAKSVSTAFQLVAVIFQLQSLQQFGGVSATHLDWTMVPYVRMSFWKHFKDGLRYCEDLSDIEIADIFNTNVKATKLKWWQKIRNWFDPFRKLKKDWIKSEFSEMSIDNEELKIKFPKAYTYAIEKTTAEIKQSTEGLYHNLNTLQSRSGNQLPFTSINYGTCTLLEGRMVTKALIESSIEGIGKLHKTSIFPCGIFQCMEGVNRKPGDPNYDLFLLALRSTATRLYPNYANVNWSGNAGYDPNDPRTYFSTMGCRTANGYDINHEPDQNPQLKDGRGNICPVTIILPTLAMETVEEFKTYADMVGEDENEEDYIVDNFMKLLDTKIHEAKDMLIERFDYICSQSPKSASFMYENGTMFGYKPEEGIRSALKHGTLAIGQLGLAETLQILVGCDHTEEKGMELAKKIEQLFKDRCAEFKEEYKLNFGVYLTPAENLCFTAMKKFKAKYGEIPNVSDRDYFTNSMHVPVWHKISPFDKIDIESQLTGYSSAGCITYVELDGGMENNLEALETLVNYAMDHDIPYFAINVPNDTCLECGYTGEFNDKCPMCGSDNIQQLRRVTGYLTGDYKSAFNEGKQKEAEDRFRHSTLIEK